MESFSIVDKNDRHLSVVFGKQELHRSNNYHRSVHIFVEMFGGKFILQKKAMNTENGGKWSSAASGHVRYGETYGAAAMRELEEEIGLKADAGDLQRITKISPSHSNGNEFITLYTYLMDPENESLKLQSDEVDGVAIRSLVDVIEDVCGYKDEYSPAFVELFYTFLNLSESSTTVDVMKDVCKYKNEYSPAFVELFYTSLELAKGGTTNE